jgi:Holliday junction resolvasome RuvABC endonuclease subunit
MIIGIDSGYTGAICVLDDVISFFDMPLTLSKTGKKILDISKLTEIMRQYVGVADFVYIESVHAMPSQGVSSTFRFGEAYGILQGVLVALGLNVKYVTPQAWKKQYGLIGSEKDYARILAIKTFPDYADMLGRKKDNGRADALWIASYGASQ